ncbi:MAG: DUF2975 domain-containing protein [Clostridia bacterium]|nr:DUF2975 domain-containing protein [Clostridia bacterium]
MKKLEKLLNAESIFLVLRVAAVIAGVLGTLVALWLGFIGFTALGQAAGMGMNDVLLMALTGLLTVGIVSGCCYAALVVFFRLCGRLRQGSAFTEENARAMQVIAALSVVCGGVLFAALVIIVLLAGALVLPLFYVGLLCCAFLGVALVAYALCLLVRRAAAIQRENELTI